MKSLALLMGLTALTTLASAQEVTVAKAGSRNSEQASVANFTGVARVERLFAAVEPQRASGGLVHFEAGARTNWHTHSLGQTLIVTAGIGRVQH
jgi:quercetin dioxygenase-like cupin family protein